MPPAAIKATPMARTTTGHGGVPGCQRVNAYGSRQVYRLSLRGNRRLNHAIHMAAITQISHKHSQGRAYYDKKLAEGKTHK